MFNKLSHYLHLMRFDKPIGSFLLLWPTFWACWIAGEGQPDGRLVWIFMAGVLVMRSAGCVINDYADRDIDPSVDRTKERPLASGNVSAGEALGLFIGLILVALLLLAQLPMRVWPWSLPAALLTVLYPYMKRFFQAPQLVLGVAFSFSIPMVYVAFDHALDTVFWRLVVINIAWVIAYDTAYAMSDRDDDLKIGVRSTAILFGRYDRLMIGLLQLLVIGLLVSIGQFLSLSTPYYVGICMAFSLFAYQQWVIAERDPQRCFTAFLNNAWVGGFIWMGMILGF